MGDFAKGIKAGMKEEEPEAMAWRPQLLPSGTAAGSGIVDGAQEHAKTIYLGLRRRSNAGASAAMVDRFGKLSTEVTII